MFSEGAANDWRLRSPDNYSYYVCGVDNLGSVGVYSYSVDFTSLGVRPALRLNLTSPCFQKSTPTAQDFTLTGNDVAYDGAENPAEVTPADGMGDITVYYEGIAPCVYAKASTPPTDAGSYKVTVDVAEGSGFTAASGIELGTHTIGKADYPYETPTDLTATYGGALLDVKLTDGFTWDSSYDGDTKVGDAGKNTFMATFTPADTDNYKVINDVPLEITVGKANPAYTAPTDLTATYGDLLSSVKLPDGFAWDSSYDKNATVGYTGRNTFLASFTPADTENYNVIDNIPIKITVRYEGGANCVIEVKTHNRGSVTTFVNGKAARLDASNRVAVLSSDLITMTAVASPGYAFTGFIVDYADGSAEFLPDGFERAFDENVTIRVCFTPTAKKHVIAVTGGKVLGKRIATVIDGTLVTLIPSDPDSFGYWALDAAGEKALTTIKNYSFAVTDSMAVYAISAGNEAKPSVLMSSANVAKSGSRYKMTLTAAVNIPKGYTVKSYGVMIVKNPVSGFDADEFLYTNTTVNGQKISAVAAKSTNTAGQYKVTITSVPKAATAAARAYLVCEKDGETLRVYSDVVYLSNH